MENLEGALREVRDEVTADTLDHHRVFRFRTVTPAHTFESVVMVVGGDRLVELTARDSFDERLARFLLDQVAGLELPELTATTIRVLPVHFPEPWRFDALVVVPPRVATRFEHESAELQRVTYWVIPAFDGEFAGGADGGSFWHQIRRKDGWRSVVVRWDRLRKEQPNFDD